MIIIRTKNNAHKKGYILLQHFDTSTSAIPQVICNTKHTGGVINPIIKLNKYHDKTKWPETPLSS